jgi:fermentation-respiration switch protein FrsA (DUF1100 family)
MPGYEELTPPAPQIPVVIIHGWRDDIVPVEHSIRFARQCRATLHVLNGDHRLTDNISEINLHLQQFVRQIATQNSSRT